MTAVWKSFWFSSGAAIHRLIYGLKGERPMQRKNKDGGSSKCPYICTLPGSLDGCLSIYFLEDLSSCSLANATFSIGTKAKVCSSIWTTYSRVITCHIFLICVQLGRFHSTSLDTQPGRLLHSEQSVTISVTRAKVTFERFPFIPILVMTPHLSFPFTLW